MTEICVVRRCDAYVPVPGKRLWCRGRIVPVRRVAPDRVLQPCRAGVMSDGTQIWCAAEIAGDTFRRGCVRGQPV